MDGVDEVLGADEELAKLFMKFAKPALLQVFTYMKHHDNKYSGKRQVGRIINKGYTIGEQLKLLI
jgi:hypothetical protein